MFNLHKQLVFPTTLFYNCEIDVCICIVIEIIRDTLTFLRRNIGQPGQVLENPTANVCRII